MVGLESQEEDVPNRVLFFKPMSWLGQIRPHRRDESWSASLWQTFFSTSLCTCTSHSGAKKFHDGCLTNLLTIFLTTHKVKTQEVVKNRGHHCGDIELSGYLANATGPWPFVMDLRVAHDRVGSSTPLYSLLWVRLGGYIVNLSETYSYRFIWKLTVFFAASGVLANFSSINLVFVFRCSSSTNNPVLTRSVHSSFLVFSRSSHRYSLYERMLTPVVGLGDIHLGS